MKTEGLLINKYEVDTKVIRATVLYEVNKKKYLSSVAPANKEQQQYLNTIRLGGKVEVEYDDQDPNLVSLRT